MISRESSTPPSGKNQPPVDPLPSSSPSSSSPGESMDTTNQADKKKKKGKKKKKKKIQHGGNQETIALNETFDEKSSDKPHKV